MKPALSKRLARAGVAALMVLNGLYLTAAGGRPEKAVVEEAWRLPFAGVQSAVFTLLAPGERPVLVLQNPRELALATPEGRLVRSLALDNVITLATGDVDGDAADEIVLLRRGPRRVEVLNEDLRPAWTARIETAREPSRVLAADLDGDGRAEVVVGGPAGLDAFTPDGRLRWSYRFGSDVPGEKGELRGLDDLRRPQGRLVAAGRRDGTVVVLDAAGSVRTAASTHELRRLRSADVDGDGRDEALLGHDDGTCVLLRDDGGTRLVGSLGEAVVELRRIEADGRRERAEVALGGKRGSVAVVRGHEVLFEEHVGARVSALGGVDGDGDGRDELAVGSEDGRVTVFGPTGARLAELAPGGKLERVVPLDTRDGRRLILVAGGPATVAYRLRRETAPAWYSPLTALALGLLGFVGLGAVLARVHTRGPLRPPAAAGVATAPLSAARERLAALVSAGHVSPTQAAERLDQLARREAKAALVTADDEPVPAPAPYSPPPPPRQA